MNSFKCDKPFTTYWYKFEGGAGTQMPDQVVPTHHCGTHAPGWPNGSHPTVAEGIVSRQVCFHWSGNPCKWSRFIRVRNCGKYYVYLLFETPTCYLRYCGNSDQGNVKGGMGRLKFLLDHDTYLDQFLMPDRVARGNYSS